MWAIKHITEDLYWNSEEGWISNDDDPCITFQVYTQEEKESFSNLSMPLEGKWFKLLKEKLH